MRIILLLIVTTLVYIPASQAQTSDKVGQSLRYTICHGPDDSSACFVAFHKMRRLKNPINGKNFFDDNVHYTEDGQLFMYPVYAVAQPDLDGDGFKEIITVPHEQEETTGMFCKKQGLCPHFILQDRNLPGKKPSLQNIKAIGPIYSYGIGLSTNEVVGGYRSLRAYTNSEITKFDIYQYDRKSDNYFNISSNR